MASSHYSAQLKTLLDFLRRPTPEVMYMRVTDEVLLLHRYGALWRSTKNWKSTSSQTDLLEQTALLDNRDANSGVCHAVKSCSPYIVAEEAANASVEYLNFVKGSLKGLFINLLQHLKNNRSPNLSQELLDLLLPIADPENFSEEERYVSVRELLKMGRIGMIEVRGVRVQIGSAAMKVFILRLISFLSSLRETKSEGDFIELVVINVSQLLHTFIDDREKGKDIRFWRCSSTQTIEESDDSFSAKGPFSAENWIDYSGPSPTLTVSCVDTPEEFCTINDSSYSSFETMSHRKKRFRHAYSQAPLDDGYRIRLSASSPSFIYDDFGRNRTCHFPMKSVATDTPTESGLRKSKMVKQKITCEQKVESIPPFVLYALQFWTKIQKKQDFSEVNASNWNCNFLRLLEYHYHFAKNPGGGRPEKCLEHPRRKKNDCKMCYIASLAPPPWYENLSSSIYRLIREQRGPRCYRSERCALTSDLNVFLQCLRSFHKPSITARIDSFCEQQALLHIPKSYALTCDCATFKPIHVLYGSSESEYECSYYIVQAYEWFHTRAGVAFKKIGKNEYLHEIFRVTNSAPTQPENCCYSMLLHIPNQQHFHVGCANCGKPELCMGSKKPLKCCVECARFQLDVGTYYCSDGCALFHWFEHKKFHEAATELSHYNYDRERSLRIAYPPVELPIEWPNDDE